MKILSMSNTEYEITIIMLPKLIITDVDGVLTNGGMYYDQYGNEWKQFNTYDSFGILLCKEANILTGVITGEDTEIVKRRMSKLKIDYLFQGVSDKLSCAENLCNEIDISLNEVAYIGDDVGDYHLLRAVGFSGAPNNASEYIKKIVSYITKKNGGSGAFREFVEYIFHTNGIYDNIFEKILKSR